jgi:hypothetical protein
MFEKSRINEGMTVFSSDGEKLGKVHACGRETFVVEKGFFFQKVYIARYDDVADVVGDDVRLSIHKDALAPVDTGVREGTQGLGEPIAGSETATTDPPIPTRTVGIGSDIAPDEGVDVAKRQRAAGEVRRRTERAVEQRAAEEGERKEGRAVREDDITGSKIPRE